MPENPLKATIQTILYQCSGPISEHQLICELKARQLISDTSTLDSLYYIHFLVMNALYQLQTELLDQAWYLSISPLEINLLRTCTSSTDNALAEDVGGCLLRDYYLDWRNLEGVNREGLQKLMDQFWYRFAAWDQRSDALTVLGLNCTAQWQDIQLAYRKKAAELHPDKGGDAVRFREVRTAYEVLARTYKKGKHL
ncbi:DNA-J related domain-containing protein [Zooshikella harenae]|uniref:DnaJ domain-containing protein n=1 Tax=Zooshikella harenae TaxID=2827238 RepID=A0ABS5ZG71_9GAMM|nr:DNA-J related domain-containing protein [Zooshikella harenae]MBU2713057.1 DnaJ domain-containing protein [Zooshikella harenae]